MAIRTISNTGGNWNATASWVEGVVAGAADDVVATATSGPLTVTVNASALTVNFTNYTNTFIVNSGVTLTVAGAFTMVAGMTVGATSTGTLTFQTSATYTSGGKTWPGNLTFTPTGSRIYTLGDAWTVSGNLTVTNTNNVQVTFTNNSITVGGNITLGAAALNLTIVGTGTLIAAPDTLATCTISTPTLSSNTTALRCPLTLNGSGTIVFSHPSGSSLDLGSVNHTNGTISMSSTTELRFSIASTLAFNNQTLAGTIRFNASVTFTLSNAFTVSGALTFGTIANTVSPVLNGSTITITGNLTTQSLAGGMVLTGTTVLNVTGANSIITTTGTVVSASGRLGMNLTINSSGTVTFQSANLAYGGTSVTFTYTAGTIVYQQGAASTTWTISGAATTFTINGSGFAFPNFVATVAPTFTGSQNCSFYSYTSTTAGLSHTFTALRTYTITNGLTLTGTLASRISFLSSSSGTQSILTVQQGASLDVGYANATDIDSSLGQTIWSYRGTLLRSTNWQQLPVQPQTVANFNI